MTARSSPAESRRGILRRGRAAPKRLHKMPTMIPRGDGAQFNFAQRYRVAKKLDEIVAETFTWLFLPVTLAVPRG